MKNKRLILFMVPLAIFFFLALLLGKGLQKDPRILYSAKIDNMLPAFALPSLFDAGTNLRETDIKGPALLNVWATWCPSCIAEHSVLNELSKQGITIYGLNYKDDRQEAIQFLSSRGNPYKSVIFDGEGDLGIDLGVYGAPETYLIDSKGVIRQRHIGVMSQDVWEQKLLPLLDSKS